MQSHCAQPRPVPHRPGRSDPRTTRRRPRSTHRAAGVLALLLWAWPASHSATTAFVGEAPTAGGDGATPDPAPAAGSSSRRTVFVCQPNGVPVFTDRPCGTAGEQRTRTVDAPAPGATPSTTPPRPRASTRPRLQPEVQAGTGRAADTRCATLQRQLDELDERMRHGYSSREAARLWSRWRDLKGRLRAERC